MDTVTDLDIKQMYPSRYEKGYRAKHYIGEEPTRTSIVEHWDTQYGQATVSDGEIKLATWHKKIGKQKYTIYITPADVAGQQWKIAKYSGKFITIESNQKSYTLEELDIIKRICKNPSCEFERILSEYLMEWMCSR